MIHDTAMKTKPWLGAFVGAFGVLLIVVTVALVDPHVARAVPLLLLFIPVTLSGAVGGWRASVPVALGSGLLYSFSFVAPVGAIRIGLTEDTVTITTFVAAALTVSAIGGIRVQSMSERDEQRAMMMQSVSHDLRNPLGVIRAASADLRDDIVSDPVARTKLLGIMVEETDRIDRIVGNMLDLSRIESGALAPDLHHESLSMLVQQCVTRPGAPWSSTEVRADVPDDADDVLVDHTQVDQVLTNLLDNAMRHGLGPITIDASPSGRMVNVSVSDRGPGFVRSKAPASATSSLAKGSSGIGLALCKAIVEAHGGTIATGERPGGGARVTFSVPKAR